MLCIRKISMKSDDLVMLNLSLATLGQPGLKISMGLTDISKAFCVLQIPIKLDWICLKFNWFLLNTEFAITSQAHWNFSHKVNRVLQNIKFVMTKTMASLHSFKCSYKYPLFVKTSRQTNSLIAGYFLSKLIKPNQSLSKKSLISPQ